MDFCISADQLRKALAEIETAERNGFNHCLSVFKLTSAGHDLRSCRAEYSDIWEIGHPTDPSLNWGRFQGVTRLFRLRKGKLVRIKPLPHTTEDR